MPTKVMIHCNRQKKHYNLLEVCSWLCHHSLKYNLSRNNYTEVCLRLCGQYYRLDKLVIRPIIIVFKKSILLCIRTEVIRTQGITTTNAKPANEHSPGPVRSSPNFLNKQTFRLFRSNSNYYKLLTWEPLRVSFHLIFHVIALHHAFPKIYMYASPASPTPDSCSVHRYLFALNKNNNINRKL
jgi:hypothetical protein